MRTSILAQPTEKTPIMLTQHIYWNLDAFQGADDVLNYKLHIDSSRVVAVDGDAIPTGEFIDVTDTPWDFRETKAIDWRWNETVGLCGGGKCVLQTLQCLWLISNLSNEGCSGYDHCWIYDHSEAEKPGVTVWSDLSGIRLVCSPYR